jgi:hypothetical protein
MKILRTLVAFALLNVFAVGLGSGALTLGIRKSSACVKVIVTDFPNPCRSTVCSHEGNDTGGCSCHQSTVDYGWPCFTEDMCDCDIGCGSMSCAEPWDVFN